METEYLKFDKELVIGILSGKASTAISRRLYRDFRAARLSITPEQFNILLSLSSKDGITQQDLAKSTFRDKPSITRLIDNMEKMSLVVRLTNKADRRINLIYVTKIGLSVYQQATEVALNVMKDALADLESEELLLGEQILKKIFKNLS